MLLSVVMVFALSAGGLGPFCDVLPEADGGLRRECDDVEVRRRFSIPIKKPGAIHEVGVDDASLMPAVKAWMRVASDEEELGGLSECAAQGGCLVRLTSRLVTGERRSLGPRRGPGDGGNKKKYQGL